MSRLFFTLLIAGLAVTGTILGYRALSGGNGKSASSPETATPSPDEAGDWTPERLKEAKPLELPHAPPTAGEEPDTPQPGPSQSGAGSAGSGDVAPEEGTTLIPGLPKPGDDPAP